MATHEEVKRLGGLIRGIAGEHGGGRGDLLLEAAEQLDKGTSTKAVADILETAITWSSMPSPQLMEVYTALTGEQPEIVEPLLDGQHTEAELREQAAADVAKAAAADKGASTTTTRKAADKSS